MKLRNWYIVNSNGPVAVFGAAGGLSAGKNEVAIESLTPATEG